MNPLYDKIEFGSQSETAICLHEAGHACVALVVGADLSFVELNDDSLLPGLARNRIQTQSQQQRRLISCGGYAVEYNLFKSGRLVDEAGDLLSEKAFIDQAVAQNAATDKFQFFDIDPSQTDRDWSKQEDRSFMDAAHALADTVPMDVVFAIAEALMDHRRLESNQILTIVNDVQSARSQA